MGKQIEQIESIVVTPKDVPVISINRILSILAEQLNLSKKRRQWAEYFFSESVT